MADLNKILDDMISFNIMPVIQLSNGLYVVASSVDPDSNSEEGTNLLCNYNDYITDENVLITIKGTWDSSHYDYDIETGVWNHHYDVEK